MAERTTSTIRLATAADAPTVARLLGAFRDFYGESEPADEPIRAAVERLISDDDTDFLLAGDPPAGVAQLRFRHSVWTGADDAWLEDLFVEPEARRRGVGEALAQACVERARERGCRRIQLDCNERNAPALALYASLGFVSTADRWDGGRDLYLTLQL